MTEDIHDFMQREYVEKMNKHGLDFTSEEFRSSLHPDDLMSLGFMEDIYTFIEEKLKDDIGNPEDSIYDTIRTLSIKIINNYKDEYLDDIRSSYLSEVEAYRNPHLYYSAPYPSV